jgi:hypothetical protein
MNRATDSRVELHALDDVDLGLERLVLLDRDAPSLPTFCIACDHLADRGVSLAEMVPTWATSEEAATGGAFDVDHGVDGDVDAALQIHQVHAGGDRLAALATIACASRSQSWCRHGGVVGLGGDLAQHLCAHVLELVLEFDFLTTTPSLVIRGREALLDDDVAAWGRVS